MLPTQHVKKATILALAIGAIAPAAASAKPVGPDTAPFTAPTTPIVQIATPRSGFDWADAGIGAAGGLAITMLGVGGALVVSQRRTRHPHRPATPTS